MTEPYLKNTFDGVDLYYDFSLLDYDDIPIVFVCHDDNYGLYLCNCTEIRQHQQWIIARTTLEIIKLIIDGVLSVYDALMMKVEEKCLVTYVYRSNTYECKNVWPEDIPDNRLPAIDSKLRFIESNVENKFADLKERYEKYAKKCGTCKHFIGGGDWNLCCDLHHPDYPCGFLCYEDTVACKDYKEGKYEWHYDRSRFT